LEISATTHNYLVLYLSLSEYISSWSKDGNHGSKVSPRNRVVIET
jgi:hypothetical protein